MKIGKIMSDVVVTVLPGTPVTEAAMLMRDHDIGGIPLAEDEKLIGMVTDRDIVIRGVARGPDIADLSVEDVMTDDLYYCADDDDLERAAQMMAEHQVRRLPVLDSDKRLVGIVSLADLSLADEEAGGDALDEISEPTSRSHS